MCVCIGTVSESCYWLGVNNIMLVIHSSSPENPKVSVYCVIFVVILLIHLNLTLKKRKLQINFMFRSMHLSRGGGAFNSKVQKSI